MLGTQLFTSSFGGGEGGETRPKAGAEKAAHRAQRALRHARLSEASKGRTLCELALPGAHNAGACAVRAVPRQLLGPLGYVASTALVQAMRARCARDANVSCPGSRRFWKGPREP